MDDDFWQVVKEEKLQEGDFQVKSSKSFGGSHWCRSMPKFEHRPMDTDPHRSTEQVTACATVRILTHEEFTAKHPHPPKTFRIKKSDTIDNRIQPPIDIQTQPTINTMHLASIDNHP
ncbi:hypothetical protein F2Q69_00012733 [Brassica cretica]|uniref:Uncharacterized protein n=1 Tax=Brassica cretica TaxID=69181 RepID=A0A8S9R463_BRACR|nr:hypothetical protein F2Q69_00012733 [Brassica cretica]